MSFSFCQVLHQPLQMHFYKKMVHNDLQNQTCIFLMYNEWTELIHYEVPMWGLGLRENTLIIHMALYTHKKYLCYFCVSLNEIIYMRVSEMNFTM
jgi:hypothetical protein